MIQESIITVIRSRGLSESDIDAIVAIVGERWEYIAGQYYTGEIKTLRECILKG